jgi:hypothetical protein
LRRRDQSVEFEITATSPPNPALKIFLALLKAGLFEFFSFIRSFFGIRHDPGGNSICPVSHRILLGVAVFAWIVPPAVADLFPASGPVVSGKTARLRFGKAAAPKNAPLAVKRAIWAANQLRHKGYRYGGGHKSFDDRSYDCSGTISYVLGAAGLISAPMSSTEFRSYGDRGPGKWITIYAREGHTFAVIARLRIDTTPYDRYTGKWAPRWQTIYRPPRGFDARHPVGL